jgi:hypothetical protein
MSIELVPLCKVRVQIKPPIVVGTGPAGTRVILELASVQAEGDRLRAEMVGAASADWILIGPEGTATLDVRATLRTDDGAIVFVQFIGKYASDASQDPDLTEGPLYVTPRFETGDERYAWLNRVQAVGKGAANPPDSVDFEWWEVR